jgi:hypothetical protein
MAETVAPLRGVNARSFRSGGLRYAPTTGYYLPAFQAEDTVLNSERGVVISVYLR